MPFSLTQTHSLQLNHSRTQWSGCSAEGVTVSGLKFTPCLMSVQLSRAQICNSASQKFYRHVSTNPYTHCSEFIQSNLHCCPRAATLWPGKLRLLHVQKSPIVYPKARITSVPSGSWAEPSVIWGYPNGIWHHRMRFYNQVKIKGQECLEASITHNFTLWCLQKSVLGTMLSAIHWCLWFTFAVPGSRIACKICSCRKGKAEKRGKKNPLEIVEFGFHFFDTSDFGTNPV